MKNLDKKDAVSPSTAMICSTDAPGKNAERITPEQRAILICHKTEMQKTLVEQHKTLIETAEQQIREAVEIERKEIVAMLTDGNYCRYVDHAQDLCKCDEIKKDIFARDS